MGLYGWDHTDRTLTYPSLQSHGSRTMRSTLPGPYRVGLRLGDRLVVELLVVDLQLEEVLRRGALGDDGARDRVLRDDLLQQVRLPTGGAGSDLVTSGTD